ncbi:hypothetical protein [Streptomyces sp. NPDC057694]|uniref:hypothetical protein n=1 Tax=Streptomyces sp. NPDC057694 TaxID=3346216 RepID=UPI0036829660
MEDDTAGPGTTERELDCRIYVATHSRDQLMKRLAAALNVPVYSPGTLTYGCLDVRWAHNDYEGTGAGDEFLDWHSLIECEPHSGASSAAAVTDTASILNALRAAGFRAVPVCDFDELLP